MKVLLLTLFVLIGTLLLIVKFAVIKTHVLVPREKTLSFGSYLREEDRHRSPERTSRRIQTVVGSSLETELNHLEWYTCQANTDSRMRKPRNSTWTRLPSDREIFLLSSGYFDDRYASDGRRKNFVRLLALFQGEQHGRKKLYCNFRERDLSVEAKASEIWIPFWNTDSHAETLHSYLISCPLPDAANPPDSITVSASKPCEHEASLGIKREGYYRFLQRGRHRPKKFCLCVKPLLFSRRDISSDLIEWIEIQRLFGAGKIVFYVYGVHDNVRQTLEYYQGQGLVQIVPWSLPHKPLSSASDISQYFRNDIWQKRRTEVLPYNHCFYENLYQFDFVVPIDIDEIIVPKTYNTWTELFSEMERRNPRALVTYGSFSVLNAYFFKSWGQMDGNLLNIERYTERSSNFSQPGYSVKSFVNTRVAVSLFNHYALTSLQPTQKLNAHLNSEEIQMNHYKMSCPTSISSQCDGNYLKYHQKDTSVLKHVDEIVQRVKVAKDNIETIDT